MQSSPGRLGSSTARGRRSPAVSRDVPNTTSCGPACRSAGTIPRLTFSCAFRRSFSGWAISNLRRQKAFTRGGRVGSRRPKRSSRSSGVTSVPSRKRRRQPRCVSFALNTRTAGTHHDLRAGPLFRIRLICTPLLSRIRRSIWSRRGRPGFLMRKDALESSDHDPEEEAPPGTASEFRQVSTVTKQSPPKCSRGFSEHWELVESSGTARPTTSSGSPRDPRTSSACWRSRRPGSAQSSCAKPMTRSKRLRLRLGSKAMPLGACAATPTIIRRSVEIVAARFAIRAPDCAPVSGGQHKGSSLDNSKTSGGATLPRGPICGVWRSLVARLNGVQEVSAVRIRPPRPLSSSNP